MGVNESVSQFWTFGHGCFVFALIFFSSTSRSGLPVFCFVSDGFFLSRLGGGGRSQADESEYVTRLLMGG